MALNRQQLDRKRREASAIAKKINSRIANAERRGLSNTVDYKELMDTLRNVKGLGRIKGDSTKKNRFNEAFTFTPEREIERFLTELQRAESLTGFMGRDKEVIKQRDLKARFAKRFGVEDVNEDLINDYFEAQKNRSSRELMKQFSSDQIFNLVQKQRKIVGDFDMLDDIMEEYERLYSGQQFDMDKFETFFYETLRNV